MKDCTGRMSTLLNFSRGLYKSHTNVIFMVQETGRKSLYARTRTMGPRPSFSPSPPNCMKKAMCLRLLTSCVTIQLLSALCKKIIFLCRFYFAAARGSSYLHPQCNEGISWKLKTTTEFSYEAVHHLTCITFDSSAPIIVYFILSFLGHV